MAWICEDCGNTKLFRREGQYTGTAETEEYYDAEEGRTISETDPEDQADFELDEYTNTQCDDCGSSEVREDISDSELLEIRTEHTREDGSWSEEVLEPDEQNEDLRAELGVNKL